MAKRRAFFRAHRIEITGRKPTSKGAMKSPAAFLIPNLNKNPYSASYQDTFRKTQVLLVSTEEQTLRYPLISLMAEGECQSKLWFTMKYKPSFRVLHVQDKSSHWPCDLTCQFRVLQVCVLVG